MDDFFFGVVEATFDAVFIIAEAFGHDVEKVEHDFWLGLNDAFEVFYWKNADVGVFGDFGEMCGLFGLKSDGAKY